MRPENDILQKKIPVNFWTQIEILAWCVFVSFFCISNYSLHLKELFTDFNGGPRNRLFFETIYGLYGLV